MHQPGPQSVWSSVCQDLSPILIERSVDYARRITVMIWSMRWTVVGLVTEGLRGWRVAVQRQLDAYDCTPAEQRVVWTLFDVHTNIDIGTMLESSPQTIKNHMTRILHKTQTRNRLELVLLLLHLADEEMPQPGLPPATWVRHRRSMS